MQFSLFDPPPARARPVGPDVEGPPANWVAARRRLVRRPGGHVYLEAFASLTSVASAAGLEPGDLESGFSELAEQRGWAPSTRALYGAVCSYAGLSVERASPPRPRPVTGVLSWLTIPAPPDDGPGLRAVAWIAVATGWPASLERWSALGLEEIDVTGSGVRVAGRLVSGVGGAWLAWTTWRERRPELRRASPALCVLRSGRTAGSVPGARLARRSLEDAFRKHAARCAERAAQRDPGAAALLGEMTYDTYRRAVIDHGADVVDRGRGAGRLCRPGERGPGGL
jgi:hypothetical protein